MKKFFRDSKQKPVNYKFGDDIPLDWLNYNRKSISESRINFIQGVIFLVFIIIILRLWYFCFNFAGGTTSNLNRKKEVSFHRPNIVDRNNIVLATNLPTYNLYVEPKNVVDAEKSAVELVKILPSLKLDEVRNKLLSEKSFIYIARKITPLEREKIILIGEPGFKFEENEDRVYPQSNLFAHIVGSVDIDNKGISGIEKYIDNENLVNLKEPVVLSVDSYIQDAVRQNLVNAMKEYGAKSSAGIVMDVQTGEILSMVSLPDFHNNEYKKFINNPLYNNHVSLDVYEVGSVMKIFNTALAIENNYPNDKFFNVLNGFMVGNYKVKDSHPHKKMLNMTEGFIQSSNVVMANIAQDLGIEKQKEFLSKLNLLKKVNFELPERASPIVPKDWNEHLNATIGYGYGLSPTMLHVVVAVNAIVNDGMFVMPTILKKNENSKLISYQVVSPSTSYTVRKLMRDVITDGTGYMANLKDIKVGGKTGTSIKLIDKKYTDEKKRTFFISVFPVDIPKYTMLIMLDEAKNKWCDSASCTTVPVSAKIIEEIAPILRIDGLLKNSK